MILPEKSLISHYSKEYNLIPVCRKFRADTLTPISLYLRLGSISEGFLLESVEGGEKWGRFSFVGTNPFLILKVEGGSTVLEYRNGKKEYISEPVFPVLKKLLKKYKAPSINGIPSLSCGAVGYFAYDMIRYVEKLEKIPDDDIKMPDCNLMFFDEIIAYDHLKQEINIIVSIHKSENPEAEYDLALNRINELYEKINYQNLEDSICDSSDEVSLDSEYQYNIDKQGYMKNVSKAREYIHDGDIFQVVLSQRLSTSFKGNPFSVYRKLRTINPSPYMYYIKQRDAVVTGASPEMLIKASPDGVLQNCPIAGTRKRGKTAEEDRILEEDLLDDEKEISEHMMLVDLGRNDLGKVSQIGSVNVKEFKNIVRYSHVMHISTTLESRLGDEYDNVDALMSVLPAGTLSGAPKIRAMEIIDELENTKRGVYGGATGYFGFDGSMDFCITIRTMIFKDQKVYIQSGAGIVADSDPEKEYFECINKAQALIEALKEEALI